MSELLPRLAPGTAAFDGPAAGRTGAPGPTNGGSVVALVDLHGLRQAARRRIGVVLLTSAVGLMAAG